MHDSVTPWNLDSSIPHFHACLILWVPNPVIDSFSPWFLVRIPCIDSLHRILELFYWFLVLIPDPGSLIPWFRDCLYWFLVLILCIDWTAFAIAGPLIPLPGHACCVLPCAQSSMCSENLMSLKILLGNNIYICGRLCTYRHIDIHFRQMCGSGSYTYCIACLSSYFRVWGPIYD